MNNACLQTQYPTRLLAGRWAGKPRVSRVSTFLRIGTLVVIAKQRLHASQAAGRLEKFREDV